MKKTDTGHQLEILVMPDCKSIIHAFLVSNNYDGLAAEDCGCGLDDLAPCGEGPFPSCVAAKSRVLADGEYIGECGPADTIFEEA